MKRKQEDELLNRKKLARKTVHDRASCNCLNCRLKDERAKLARKAVKPDLERTFSEYKLEMPKVTKLTICYVHPTLGLLAQIPVNTALYHSHSCACAITHNISGFVYCVNWDVRSFLLMTDKEFDDLKLMMSLGPLFFPCADPEYCINGGGIHEFSRFPRCVADLVTDMRKPTAFEPSPALCEKELTYCCKELPNEVINLIVWWCRMVHATVNVLHI